MKKLNQIILIILSNLLFVVCNSNTKHEENKTEKIDSVSEEKKIDDENKIEKNNSVAEAESFDDNIYYETVSKLSDSLNQNINIDTLLLDKLPKGIEILDSLTYPNSLIFKNSNEIDTIKMALKLGNHFKVWTIYSEKWDCKSNFGVDYDNRIFEFKTKQLDGVGNEELIIVMTYMKSYNNIPIWSYVENWQTYTVWNFDNMKLLFSLQTQYNYESYIEDPNDVLKVYNYDIKFLNKQININKKELNFKTFGGQPKIKYNSKYSYKFNGKEFIKVK